MKRHKVNRWKRIGNYTYQKRLSSKDNRTIYKGDLGSDGFYDQPLSLGERVMYSSRVRVPKLKRKTAWKRFYRLFPHLKGMTQIPGSSSRGLNDSTIKLR